MKRNEVISANIRYFGLILALFIFGILTEGCRKEKTLKAQQAKSNTASSSLLFATLYNGYAAEYKALAYQAYNLAGEKIRVLRKSEPRNQKLAVILDIDETVLDNSPYQAKLIKDHIQYDSLWNEWCRLESAKAVPGALEFCLLADSLNFQVIYLSNRKDKFVRDATLNNLKKLGFPQLDPQNLILRDGSSSKESRRAAVEEKFEIALLIGDNLGDFFEDPGTARERDSMVIAKKTEFGNRFIILPNAMYGNWVESLGLLSDPEATTLLIDSMILDFNKL